MIVGTIEKGTGPQGGVAVDAVSVAALAAGASALTSIVITVLNVALVRATRDSVREMSAQTREVMNTRLDARAPRVIVREWTVLPGPMTTLRKGGRSTRPVTDEELNRLARGSRVDMLLSAAVNWTVANEGSVTARVELPQDAVPEEEDGSVVSQQIFLAPGDIQRIVARVEATLDQWLGAAQDQKPISRSFSLVVDDGFADGVRDLLGITVETYLIVRYPGESGSLSGTSEARLAANLEARVQIHPIKREYP